MSTEGWHPPGTPDGWVLPTQGAVARGPESIRALAHPLRLKILSILDKEDEVTATRCAQLTGESAASCSFHLRQLEKYGYVERAEVRGKERPWRAAKGGFSVQPDLEVPGSVEAAKAFAQLYFRQVFDELTDWVGKIEHDQPEWLYASTQTSSIFWATSAELHELSREIEQLTHRFAGRGADPAKRPPGARRAHFFGATHADVPEQPDVFEKPGPPETPGTPEEQA